MCTFSLNQIQICHSFILSLVFWIASITSFAQIFIYILLLCYLGLPTFIQQPSNKLKRIFLDFEALIFPDSAFQSFFPEFSQKGQILVISWPLIILATMVDSKWHQSWTEFCITILSSFFVCCSSWTEGWHCDILKYFCIWMVILFAAFIFVLISIWSSTVHTRHVRVANKIIFLRKINNQHRERVSAFWSVFLGEGTITTKVCI